MGVPALFRWLSQKYPKIISPVIEERPQEIDGETIPVDTTGPNPNNEEFDNLYLDMNGIVHPCSHPEDKAPPETEQEMMMEIFKYTERVVNMARPRKLLMIAVDGVAPRAKMNQQRSRRFRSARDAKEKDEEKAEFLKMLQQSQRKDGPVDVEVHEAIVKKTWDSNSITPGTPFMDILAASLRYWIAYKLNTDPAWAKLKIIISDATVPGEGEHKIMEFIRSQRRSPEHDPNTRHVIYGLDADLIMLGLVTHEPHFRVLREDVFFQEEKKRRQCRICGQEGHRADECKGEAKVKTGEFDEKQNATEKPFLWLHVSVLREYLAAELAVPHIPFKFDLERAIDDWVFMCFFVGNDFLPHLPSLDIKEQGIDTLIAIWRDNLPVMGGYVTKDGHVDMERAEYILAGLAKQEDAIFRRRKEQDDFQEQKNKRRKMEQEARAARNNAKSNGGEATLKWKNPTKPPNGMPDFGNIPFFDPKDAQSKEVRQMTHDNFVNRKTTFQENQANRSAAAVLKEQLAARKSSNGAAAAEDQQTAEANGSAQTPPSALGKRKADLLEEGTSTPATPDSTSKVAADEEPPDDVRLWEEGYADRYYEKKFHRDPKDIDFRRQVARDYMEGLCWVLLYYLQGCPSWTWYYPHHYAPFAADFVGVKDMTVSFDKGKPFRPYEQLMGVLPRASNHAIPPVFRTLMEEGSDIYDFYPEEFEIDLNGAKVSWKGVALLPFIDEKRLLSAMGTKYPELTEEENARNAFGKDVLLFSTKHPLYEEVATNFYSKKQSTDALKLSSKTSEGLAGKIEKNPLYIPQSELTMPFEVPGFHDIDMDESISVNYDIPHSEYVHKSMLLRGVKFPPPALDQGDIDATRNRAGRAGRSHGGAPLHMGRGGYRGDHRDGGYRGGRGGNRNGGGDRGGNRNGGGDRLNPDNPFAAHLDPNMMHGGRGPPPPPHIAAQNGWIPPPHQFGRGMPPPPFPQQGYPGPPPSAYGGNGYGGNGYGNQQHGGRRGGNGGGYGGHRGGNRY